MRSCTPAAIVGLALSLICANVARGQTTVSPTPVLFDREMTPGAGATVTLGVARLIAAAEERVIPIRLFEERGRWRQGANAAYRLGKLEFFDEPHENWFRVATHEVFGHGGRLRELFDGRIGYQLPAPPPYGRGGGATFFSIERPPTLEELLSVTVGGMEANYMMGRAIAREAIASGDWHYRDARRYLYAEYDTIRYILGVDDLEKEGHDVGDFRRVYNDVASRFDADQLSARALRRRVLWSFANPLIAYSYYSTFVSYVWSGRTRAPIPALRFFGTRYLPMVHFRLTPIGTEYVIDNAFVRNGRFVGASISVGQTIGARTWGIGLQATRLAAFRGWTLDGEGTVWHRPEWGGEVSGLAQRVVAERWGHAFAIAGQVGYKTHGFSAGDPLGEGVFARIGATLIPRSRQSP